MRSLSSAASSSLWCISHINYLHEPRTISSPIMQRCSIDLSSLFLTSLKRFNSASSLWFVLSPGPGSVLVWWHDRHRAAGPDSHVRGPEYRGGRLQPVAEPEEQVADGSYSRSFLPLPKLPQLHRGHTSLPQAPQPCSPPPTRPGVSVALDLGTSGNRSSHYEV